MPIHRRKKSKVAPEPAQAGGRQRPSPPARNRRKVAPAPESDAPKLSAEGLAMVHQAQAGASEGLGQPEERRRRARSVDRNMGSSLVGQGTELWSGGSMVDGKYKSLEERAGDDATRRGGTTLEMTFGDRRGYDKQKQEAEKAGRPELGHIPGELYATLPEWDNDKPHTQTPWLNLSSNIARNARHKVHATVTPNRMAGLLAPKAREGAGDRVAGQKDKGGVFWQREWEELNENPTLSMVQMVNSETDDKAYIPRSAQGAWEAPDLSRGDK